jgi:hypothetical protein
VPAPTSSRIPTPAQRVDALVALAPAQCRDLLGYLAQITDPRQRRGRRHPLGVVLAVAVAAVLAGARSLARDRRVGSGRARAGPGRAGGCAATRCSGSGRHQPRRPCARVLARVDPDALDLVIGRWLANQQPPPPPQPAWRRAVAVDGKTLRGSGHHGHPPVHLLAVMDHSSRAVLAQADVNDTTNEITRFQPLLNGVDLTGAVVTADALHTQHATPTGWSPPSMPPTCWSSRPTSPPCTTSWPPCRGATSPPRTTPATAATAAWNSAACRSPPSRA